MLKRITGTTLVLLIALAYWLTKDEVLSPEAQTLLASVDPSTKSSEAYTYLLGINAAQDENPAQVGQQLLTAIRQSEAQYKLGKQLFSFTPYPKNKELPLPEGELFCEKEDTALCLRNVFKAEASQIEEALTQNHILLERYQIFLTKTDYVTLMPNNLQAPIGLNLSYLRRGNQLILLKSILLAKQGKNQAALDLLEKHQLSLRQSLAQADILLYKMIVNSSINKTIDVASILLQQSASLYFTIKPLTAEELSLKSGMEWEFCSQASRLLNMENDLVLDAKEAGQFQAIKEPVFHQLRKFFYKPNATVNRMRHFYLTFQQIMSTAPNTLFERYKLESAASTQENYSIRNPIGSVLNLIPRPNYYDYAERLFNTNAKIQLFNQLYGERLTLAKIMQQPANYYNQTDHWKLRADTKTICLNSPIIQAPDFNCLLINIH